MFLSLQGRDYENKCSAWRCLMFQTSSVTVKASKCTHILAKTMYKWSFWTGSFKFEFTLHFDFKRHAPLKVFFLAYNCAHDLTCKQGVTDLLKQLTMALPDKLPVMLAPASAIVLAFSLRLSLIAPMRSMWLPLALRLPVRPPTLPSPMLGLCLVSATEVVSV